MRERTYRNPVDSTPCADPFVLKHLNTYWCYSTGQTPEGGCFRILSSRSLTGWRYHGAAMAPLPGANSQYWAPEVSYWNGRFYLYYSVGDGVHMHIRVAVSESPGGPFVDSGTRMTLQDFAIDPHVFQDDDGQRWMFYATDFLDHTHVGTGTVRDRLLNPFRLLGEPSPVVRARYEWQLFDPHRESKGGVRWHTVEGPSVLKYKGLYYEMFSGGNWQNVSYGVGYAYSRDITSNEEWHQVCDGDQVLPLLRSIPGQVTGPGHNSVVMGPDNRQMFCIYHRWNEEGTERLLAIDRMDWVGRRLAVFGPSNVPQEAPNLPAFRSADDESDDEALSTNWMPVNGDWSFHRGRARQKLPKGVAQLRYRHELDNGFTFECYARADETSGAAAADPAVGVCVHSNSRPLLWASILPITGRLRLSRHDPHNSGDAGIALYEGFQTSAPHALRVEASGRLIRIVLDGCQNQEVMVDARPSHVSLFTNGASGRFAGFCLTEGWHDTFTTAGIQPEELVWSRESGVWSITDGELCHKGHQRGGIFKPVPRDRYEFVATGRLTERTAGHQIGFYPAASLMEKGPLVFLGEHRHRWAAYLQRAPDSDPNPANAQLLSELPPHFDVASYAQFRFRVRGNHLSVALEDRPLLETELPFVGQRVGLHAAGPAAFDAVRLTALSLLEGA